MGTRFAELRVGDYAAVRGFEPGGEAYREHLLAMGLVKGTTFRLVKIAPLGDPVKIELRGFSLSLRRREADVLKLDRLAPRKNEGGAS